jgi:hypothetical protein
MHHLCIHGISSCHFVFPKLHLVLLPYILCGELSLLSSFFFLSLLFLPHITWAVPSKSQGQTHPPLDQKFQMGQAKNFPNPNLHSYFYVIKCDTNISCNKVIIFGYKSFVKNKVIKLYFLFCLCKIICIQILVKNLF